MTKAVLAQTAFEVRLTMRRGEAVLLNLVIPVGILLFFGATELFGVTVEFLVPGLLALAVISSSLVSLAISTGFERKYLVLKRLGATPLPRWGLVLAKAVSVLVVEAMQVALVLGLAAGVFGWRAPVRWPLLLVGILLGTAALSGLAMTIAGRLRAEATLAIANGLYVLFLLVGDVIFPIDALPAWVVSVARAAPAAPLAAWFREAVGAAAGSPIWPLVPWAVITPLVAAWAFTWEER